MRSPPGRARHGREEAACTGGAASRTLVAGAELDDRAEVHHGHPVGDVPDDGEVVGDEQEREPEVPWRSCSRLTTRAWIETSSARHRLVGDEEVRFECERTGDADALTLAAGERVRVPAGGPRGRPTSVEQLAHRARRRSRPPILWARSGSETMSPTFIRGFSERRGPGRSSGRDAGSRGRSARPICARSMPSKRIYPRAGWYRPSSVRPVVVFPQPDSPTSASVSPRAIDEADAVDRPDPCLSRRQPRAERGSRPRGRRPRRADSAAPARSCAGSRSLAQHATVRGAPASGSSGRVLVPQTGRARAGSEARTDSPAATRPSTEAEPRNRGKPGRRSSASIRGTDVQQPERVRVRRVLEEAFDRTGLDDRAPRT